ncbi:MAG: 16S rRNA (guanine(966)-N(2))-methyltransferase RsmD [Gammaproteobacteria bacterium]|nr:MAG: 16S rRNA (guanine(966)-N(2))-methyltransferase RsmD [Gammaproteobacteria bacterium]
MVVKSRRRSNNPSSSLRIIGGQFRGRRLPFPEQEGLRPTPDRVRETLFNWLMSRIEGARCLDLFAGSGALSFEALSRQATSVTAVEYHAQVTRTLVQNRQKLDIEPDRFNIVQDDGIQFLSTFPPHPHDVVFLDPPYSTDLLHRAIHALQDSPWLNKNAMIYMEFGHPGNAPVLPDCWQIFRKKRAGTVHYQLIQT